MIKIIKRFFQKEKKMSVYVALCIVGDAGYIVSTDSTVLNAHHTHTPIINNEKKIKEAMFVVLETGIYKLTPKKMFFELN